MLEKTQRGRERPMLFAGLVVAITAGLGVGLWNTFEHFFLRTIPEGQVELAQFGDFISGLAGGLGLLGMVLALLLQTRELSLQRRELRATQDEVRNQTAQFERQADLAAEHVRVTAAQNALLERQLALTHVPLLSVRWEATEGGATLVLVNRGHGQALVTGVSFKSPSGRGPSIDAFQRAANSHAGARNIEIALLDVGPGTLVEPRATRELLTVSADKASMASFKGYSITFTCQPAQGGPGEDLAEGLWRISQLRA